MRNLFYQYVERTKEIRPHLAVAKLEWTFRAIAAATVV